MAIKTSGMFGPEASVFMRDLGKRHKMATFEPEVCNHLLQRVSVVILWTNCMAVLGSSSVNSKDLNCIHFDLLFFIIIAISLFVFVFVILSLYFISVLVWFL